MKTTTMRSRSHWPRHGKALVALIASSVVCGVAGISMMPAHAEGNDKRDEHHDQGNHKGEKHDDRNRREQERPRYEQPRFYPQPVYAPPVVYYPPQQSPGISLFLPLDIHIR